MRIVLAILTLFGPMAATPAVWASVCEGAFVVASSGVACGCCASDDCCCSAKTGDIPAPTEPSPVPVDGMQVVRVILALNPLAIAEPIDAGEIVFPDELAHLLRSADADAQALFCIWLT